MRELAPVTLRHCCHVGANDKNCDLSCVTDSHCCLWESLSWTKRTHCGTYSVIRVQKILKGGKKAIKSAAFPPTPLYLESLWRRKSSWCEGKILRGFIKHTKSIVPKNYLILRGLCGKHWLFYFFIFETRDYVTVPWHSNSHRRSTIELC